MANCRPFAGFWGRTGICSTLDLVAGRESLGLITSFMSLVGVCHSHVKTIRRIWFSIFSQFRHYFAYAARERQRNWKSTQAVSRVPVHLAESQNLLRPLENIVARDFDRRRNVRSRIFVPPFHETRRHQKRVFTFELADCSP